MTLSPRVSLPIACINKAHIVSVAIGSSIVVTVTDVGSTGTQGLVCYG